MNTPPNPGQRKARRSEAPRAAERSEASQAERSEAPRDPGPRTQDPLRRGRPSIDTRTLEPGDLFFCLRGERDGHDFAAEAIAKGAAAVVADHPLPVEGKVIVVPDTLAALQQLAAEVRNEWGGTLIAVTGSAGKTTTKEMIAHLLEAAFPVGKSEGNLNNHIGVPLSLLRMPRDRKVWVIEIGMNHPGEIRHLAKIARPDIAVVTNVGTAHIQNFENGIEGIASAKRELIEALPPNGTAILNQDDPRVLEFRKIHPGPTITFGLSPEADIHPAAAERSEANPAERAERATFPRTQDPGPSTHLPGRHNLLNLQAALAVAHVFHIPEARLREAVASLTPGKMRGEVFTLNGATIINDCYNSNPEAARSMLDVLSSTPASRHIAVLGEMLELGRMTEQLHREVGEYAARSGVDLLIGVRGAARFTVAEAVRSGLSESAAIFFDSPAEAGDFLKVHIQPGDAVLFKGSRGVALEKALDRVSDRVLGPGSRVLGEAPQPE